MLLRLRLAPLRCLGRWLTVVLHPCARSNPFTLLRGEVCCSPYRDKDQTDSRTSVCHLGYPYNYEPLNFVRGATSLICASFAAFEILSFRKVFAEKDKGKDEDEDGQAMVYWVYSCIFIVGFYTAMMLTRWCVRLLAARSSPSLCRVPSCLSTVRVVSRAPC